MAGVASYNKVRDEFHMMIGYCIAEWAGIDDELFRIFQSCTETKLEHAAIIYYGVPGLDPRLRMVDEIVRSVLPKKTRASGGHDHPDVKRWTAIHNDCKRLLATRRRIAHQPIRAQESPVPTTAPRIPYFLDTNPAVDTTLQTSFEIYVSQAEQMRGKQSKRSSLKLSDLRNHLIAISGVKEHLNKFFYNVIALA